MSDDIYEYVYEMPPFSGEVEIVFEEDGNNPTYKLFKQWEEVVNGSFNGGAGASDGEPPTIPGALIPDTLGSGVAPMQAPSPEIFHLREKSKQEAKD